MGQALSLAPSLEPRALHTLWPGVNCGSMYFLAQCNFWLTTAVQKLFSTEEQHSNSGNVPRETSSSATHHLVCPWGGTEQRRRQKVAWDTAAGQGRARSRHQSHRQGEHEWVMPGQTCRAGAAVHKHAEGAAPLATGGATAGGAYICTYASVHIICNICMASTAAAAGRARAGTGQNIIP